MHPVSLGLSGRAISEAPVWKKSQEAGRPYSLSVRRPPYLVRRSLSVPGTQNRTEPDRARYRNEGAGSRFSHGKDSAKAEGTEARSGRKETQCGRRKAQYGREETQWWRRETQGYRCGGEPEARCDEWNILRC